jgi:hypothetical protein
MVNSKTKHNICSNTNMDAQRRNWDFSMMLQQTTVFIDVETCKAKLIKSLNIMSGYKYLKNDALLLKQIFRKM